MSNPEAKTSKPVDWLEPWREMRNGYMDAWAKAMTGAVNTDAYSQFSGLMLDTYLTTSEPFREAQQKIMLSTLEQMQMPTRSDFVSLAERLANLELLLDDMSAKLSEMARIVSSSVPTPEAEAEASEASKTSKSELPVDPTSLKPGLKFTRKSSARTPKKGSK
ncbi:MAG: hypothetical protein CXZ00_07070 [Acidobacteria bacterium]|nr:MAG: hypothetical protein CXZ00_07070 [Acidobacteriota bacterium]